MDTYRKRVRLTISRSGRDAQVKTKTPIGCGIGVGKDLIYASIRPGEEVCLDGRLVYSFYDAVIDREMTERVVEGGELVVKTHIEKIPRFYLNEKGFYVCNRQCKRIPEDCTGIRISQDEFRSTKEAGEFLPEKKTETPEEPVKKKRGRKPRVETQEEAVV